MIERETAEAAAVVREDRFAIIGQMREAFKDVPAEEIERNVFRIIWGMRETSEPLIRLEEQIAPERGPA